MKNDIIYKISSIFLKLYTIKEKPEIQNGKNCIYLLEMDWKFQMASHQHL